MLKAGLGKYRVIVFSIALFLVFDLGVLILNFFISKQISEATVSINLAGRQGMLTQEMTKSLLYINRQKENNLPFNSGVEELRTSYNLFNSTFKAFKNGGETIDTNSKTIYLKPVTEIEGKNIIREADVIWQGFIKVIEPIMDEDVLEDTEINPASRFAYDNNLELMRLMGELTDHVEVTTSSKANNLRMIQIVGISLATINFVIILFHFLKQLREREENLESAKKETDQILDTVTEGLFLIDREYRIGTQHSKYLHNIFRRKRIVGRNFLDFLEKVMPAATIETTRDYIDLLFSEKVKESLVTILNPLDTVEINFETPNGNFETKYLRFSFKRVINKENEIANLFISVRDVTERVQLEQDLLKSQENTVEQLNLLTSILPMDPMLLAAFLDEADKSLNKVNNILKQPTSNKTSYKAKLDKVFQTIHKLKGDAATISFDLMEKSAHEFETELDNIRKGDMQLSGNDFIAVTLKLDEMLDNCESIRNLIERISIMRDSLLKHNSGETGGPKFYQDWLQLKQLANKVGKNHNKQIELHLRGFQEVLPDNVHTTLLDVAKQLIRNSVVHGIENSNERSKSLKPKYGQLMLTLKPSANNGLEFIFEDDGQGFDYKKIKQTAVEKSFISAEKAKTIKQNQLIQLMFKPGFSTLSEAGIDAGRGVGMDIVKTKTDELGGKLSVSSVDGKKSVFKITLPTVEVIENKLSA